MTNKSSGLEKIFNASPRELYEFIEELKYQNIENAKYNWNKYSGLILGSHGIGKTACVLDFPLMEIEKKNTVIANKTLKYFKFQYFKHQGSIEEQSLEQLKVYGAEQKKIEKILSDIYLKFLTKVVIVDQSAIIVPEDISGLPSSSSDIERLKEMFDFCNRRRMSSV